MNLLFDQNLSGNGPTAAVAALLRKERETMQRFYADPEAAFLALA